MTSLRPRSLINGHGAAPSTHARRQPKLEDFRQIPQSVTRQIRGKRIHRLLRHRFRIWLHQNMVAKLEIKQPKLCLEIIRVLTGNPWRRIMTFAVRAMALVAGDDIFRRISLFKNSPALRCEGAGLGSGWGLTGKIIRNGDALRIILREFFEHANLRVWIPPREAGKPLQSINNILRLLAIEARRGGHMAVTTRPMTALASLKYFGLRRRPGLRTDQCHPQQCDETEDGVRESRIPMHVTLPT